MNVGAPKNVEDLREVPAYTIPEAAHYLNIPAATVRAWVLGTSWTAVDGTRKRFQRVLQPAGRNPNLLSFFNLAEAHVLRGLRTVHKLRLQHIRRALDYVKHEFGWQRPLLEQTFKTDGVSLFVERLGRLVDASAEGQLVMREVIEAHLDRLEWEDHVVSRVYPFTRPNGLASPRSVLIDPRFSFGRPVLRESRIATAIIAERYKAGDSIEELTRDYECTQLEIEEALRCELLLQAA